MSPAKHGMGVCSRLPHKAPNHGIKLAGKGVLMDKPRSFIVWDSRNAM